MGYGQPPVSSSGPGTAPFVPVAPIYDLNQGKRFPAGAIWLIGLGTIFLLATTGVFNGFRPDALIGLVLLGSAIWIFLHRLTASGTIGYDGSAAYPTRVFRAARAAAWIALLGLLILLNAFDILTFHHSWPFFIILAGILAILDRTLNQNFTAAYPPVPPGATSAPTPGRTQDPTQGGI